MLFRNRFLLLLALAALLALLSLSLQFCEYPGWGGGSHSETQGPPGEQGGPKAPVVQVDSGVENNRVFLLLVLMADGWEQES